MSVTGICHLKWKHFKSIKHYKGISKANTNGTYVYGVQSTQY